MCSDIIGGDCCGAIQLCNVVGVGGKMLYEEKKSIKKFGKEGDILLLLWQLMSDVKRWEDQCRFQRLFFFFMQVKNKKKKLDLSEMAIRQGKPAVAVEAWM